MTNQANHIGSLLSNLYFSLRKHKKSHYSRAEKSAVQWFREHITEGGGFPVSTGQNVSYPEVTGYIIPTLYNAGDKELALRLAEWLMTVQHDSGAFCAPDGIPYSFDTGQVLRGLLQVIEDIPQAEESARKACDWLLTQILPSGEVTTPSTDMWNLPEGRKVSQTIHLYILPPLAEAGRRLGRPEYTEAVDRALAFYKGNWNLKDFNTLSHFFGYVMEALCDLGEIELAKAGMENIETLQKMNGSIPAYRHVSWVCTPGTAQLAIVWYKLGVRNRADAALRFLKMVQNPGGGFFGSYGKGANYFPHEEIPWAAKYFLDAIHLS